MILHYLTFASVVHHSLQTHLHLIAHIVHGWLDIALSTFHLMLFLENVWVTTSTYQVIAASGKEVVLGLVV
jgi:hypothetical protein